MRESSAAEPVAPGDARRPTPFGLNTPDGGNTLTENADETHALRLILRMVINDDNTLGEVAEELNRKGFRTRSGKPWNQSTVFNMLPRLVEEAPNIYARPDWTP